MSERLPSVHRSRAVVARGPLAWLVDRLVPASALAWGELTAPAPLEVHLTVDASAFGVSMREAAAHAVAWGRAATAAVEFDRSWDEVRRVVEEPHDFGPAFERLARTMGEPGKRTADAFVPSQFDGWWQP